MDLIMTWYRWKPTTRAICSPKKELKFSLHEKLTRELFQLEQNKTERIMISLLQVHARECEGCHNIIEMLKLMGICILAICSFNSPKKAFFRNECLERKVIFLNDRLKFSTQNWCSFDNLNNWNNSLAWCVTLI